MSCKKKISSSFNTISTTNGAFSDNNNAICTTAGSNTACGTTDTDINTGTTTTTAASTSTSSSPAAKKLPLCYCWEKQR